MDNKRIMFVCTGNICRSPMAEYMLRHRLGAGTDWRVSSAGVLAVDGMPASRLAVCCLEERGIDARDHRSRQLTVAMTRQADLVIAMSRQHCRHISLEMPECRGKLFLLRSFDPLADSQEVDDPIGGDAAAYRETAAAIAASLDGLLAFMEEYRRPD